MPATLDEHERGVFVVIDLAPTAAWGELELGLAAAPVLSLLETAARDAHRLLQP